MIAVLTIVLLVYAGLELFLHVLVRRLRTGFPWLITPVDEIPRISQDVIDRHLENSFDNELGWRRKAGQSGTDALAQGVAHYRIDALGRRENPGYGDEHAPMAVYGDSFAFCRLVDDDATWPHFLSVKFGCNVANFGSGNYGIDQALLRLERDIEASRSGVILMAVVPQTIVRIQSYWMHYFEYGNVLGFKPKFFLQEGGLGLFKPAVQNKEDFARYEEFLPAIQGIDPFYKMKFKRDLLRFPYVPRIVALWRRHLRLLIALIADRLFNDRENGHGRAHEVILEENARWSYLGYIDRDIVELLRRLILRFRDACHAHGKTPIFVVLPQPADLTNRDLRSAYGRVYAELAKEPDLQVLDMTSVVLAQKDWPALYVTGTIGYHFNAKGNQVIADYLAPIIAKHLINSNAA